MASFNKLAGWCHDGLGKTDLAMTLYNKAIALTKELEDEKMEAGFLEDVGNIQCAHVEIGAGLESFRKALSIYEKQEIGRAVEACILKSGPFIG